MKLTGYTYSCNSLTDFEYDAQVITGNGNHVYQLTLIKIRESASAHIFWRVVAIWNHSASESLGRLARSGKSGQRSPLNQ